LIIRSVRRNSKRVWRRLVPVILLAMVTLACQPRKEAVVEVDPRKAFDDPNLLAAARAIESQDLSKLDSLVHNRAPVNGRGIRGASLLMFAVATKKKEAIRELLRLGADPNQTSDTGLSAVMLAAGSDDIDMLPILMDHGANPNLLNDRHEPVTFTAAQNRQWKNLDLLLDRGADINATDQAGDTLVIFLTVLNEYEPLVKMLERGADFQKADLDGHTLAQSIEQSIQIGRPRPDSKEGHALMQAKAFLEIHGVTFSVPTPRRQ
jgi:ankyrin repeat protein